MEMTEVESSHIEAIGYDSGVQQVRVRFKGGATYVYYDVPANIANNFIEADPYLLNTRVVADSLNV